ncbi:hypothetical protein K443DRAFT_105573 [Laccaria amethystina LaAM-08-1]|jgi:hypothetical protein|uniref:Unplaced genomic scaffold K443scaffold_156, whole genome shotgun sequence n=1 Tax=Laccaria amethystina LaAM-08-1 TaxID=1095629 RepID=A0A0C9XNE7_9AGAR|nr:hypothetical protein K443DRAFT_105573 [Laccaria amethystina LaAM-08-1]
MVFSAHRNINQPARKEHPDDIEQPQDYSARIVPRKGKWVPYREVWLERRLVGRVRRAVDVEVILGG